MESVNGAVLIGGRSRRMGQDKARLVGPDGRSLSAWVAKALREAGAGEVLAVGGAEDPELELPWCADLRADTGPLAGLEAALSRGGWWWVVACDLPGVRSADLQRLRAAQLDERPAVAWLGGRCQPLLGLYGPPQLAPLSAALDAGRARAVEVVGEWDPVRVELPDVPNLNTPAEFEAWVASQREGPPHMAGGETTA